MRAAVIRSASALPTAEEFPAPLPKPGELEVKVLAAGLHPLVRALAEGKHYGSQGVYPMIPGVDGVGTLPDGRPVYFSWLEPPYGTFAERAVINPTKVIPLPEGLAPQLAAAIVNPTMSGWMALRARAAFQKGQSVLVLGATGAAGQLAVQVARVFGASRVVAVGRNEAALGRLQADVTLKLDAPDFKERLRQELEASGIDVVLDYLWGSPIEAVMEALYAARERFGSRKVQLVNVGQSAGGEIRLSPGVLRSMPLELRGSGFGAVSREQIEKEIPEMLRQAAAGALKLDVEPVPLSHVDQAWSAPAEGKRAVIVP